MALLLACATSAGLVFVSTEGALVYSFQGKAIDRESSTESAKRSKRHIAAGHDPGGALSETLIDRSGHARALTPAGLGPNETNTSYFTANNIAGNKRPINSYYRVQLGEVYPGVNLQLRAIGNDMEKIFTVAPGQNPSQVQLKLDGAERLEINAAGQLVAVTRNGPIGLTAPIAFQEDASGQREPVTAAFALNAVQARYGFTLGPFDESRPLSIDPLLQSSCRGDSGPEQALALTAHPANGEAIAVGITGSANLPGRAVGAQTTQGGIFDAFVSRLTSNLSAPPCNLDINGDGAPTPDKDGVLKREA